tara:strand:- start:16992 stop:21038 length:4047 start_codon:yes stop_codon:yes gene_type:complete
MNRKKQFILVLFLVVISLFSIQAQKMNLKFRSVALPSEILSNQVNCFLETKEGFLWMGSTRGLIRYDGYKTAAVSMRTKEGTSISNHYIVALLQGDNDDIWIGTTNGIYNYNTRNELVEIPQHEKLNGINCQSLYITRKGELIIGTRNGMYIYNPTTDRLQTFKHINGLEQGLSHNIIRCIYEDSDDVLWIGTYDKLNRFDRKTNSFKSYSLQDKKAALYHQNNLILCIAEFGENNKNKLLIGTETGLAIFDKTTAKFELFTEGTDGRSLSSSVIKSIKVVASDQIWLGTDKGLNIFNSVNKTFKKYYADYSNRYAISNNVIPAIYKDTKDNIWLGTKNKINRVHLSNSQITHNQLHKNTPFFRDGVQVNAITQDSDNSYWFATSEGFAKYDRITQSFQWHLVPNSSNMGVEDIVIDKKGVVWLSTRSGLHLYDQAKDSFKTYVSDKNNKNALHTNYINDLYEDVKGRIWIGTLKGGLYRAVLNSNNEVTFFSIGSVTSGDGILDKLDILDIQEISNNILFLATNRGLKQINTVSGEFTELPLLNEFINAFCIEKDTAIWVVISTKLYRYDLINHKTKEIATIPKDVYAIEISGGDLWFSSYRKLYRMQKNGENLRQISYRYSGVETYTSASYLSSDEQLFFGAFNGFVTTNPKDLDLKINNLQVQFTNLEILNEIISPGEEINERVVLEKNINNVDYLEFDYSENTFSLEFSTLNLGAQKEEKYQYILEGYEEKWQQLSEGYHSASYTSVKPGDYIFKVKAANNLGVFTGDFRSLRIRLNPPIWASTEAIVLYVFLFLGFLMLYRWILVVRIQDRNTAEFEKIKRLKTEELVTLKTRFFTNITHELKTPLTLISSPIDDLLTKSLDEYTLKSLSLVKRNTDRLKKLVNQILDIRKIEVGGEKLRIQKYDFIAFCRQTIAQFDEEAVMRNILFQFTTEQEELVIWFDLEKVEKILFNLLSNAFKFTPNKGVIKVTLYPEFPEGNSKDSYFYLSVTDTGSGISEEDQAHIFDRFNSLASPNYSNQKGTGIGLSLIYDYAVLHGGSIKYERTTSKGSKFVFCIPIIKSLLQEYEVVEASGFLAQEIVEEQIQEEKETLKSKNLLKVLVVEDDVDMRSFIADGLKSSYAVIRAEDGREGMDMARKELPDLIVSDLMMPHIDGIEFCKNLKSNIRTSNIPFILLTAKSGLESKISGIKTGADAHIQKPFSLEHLKARIKNLIEQREVLKKAFQQELIINPSEVAVNSTDDKFLEDLLAKIELEMDNSDLSVKYLSELLGMSSTNMYRKIKTITGQTATEFIRTTRLKRAKQLLKTGQLNVSEVMYMVGFTHRSYFTRCFKELFGVAPKSYGK